MNSNKRALPFFLFFLLTHFAFSQTRFQKVLWLQIPGYNFHHSIRQSIIDNNGDFVFAGYVKDDFLQRTIISVFKTDSIGNLKWYKLYQNLYGSSGGASSIIETNDNNYLIVGGTYDSLELKPTSFVLKIDTSGSILWTKIFPDSLNSFYLNEIKQSSTGEIYLTGSVNNFNLGLGMNLFIAKMNSNGNLDWSKCISDTYDLSFSVDTTYDRGCIISGHSVISNGNTDIYFCKLDSSGNRLWSKKIIAPGDDGFAGLVCIKQLEDSGFILCATTNSFGFGNYDILLIRLDPSGDIVWSKVIGTPDSDLAAEIKLLSDGNYLIYGSTYDSNFINVATAMKIDTLGEIIWSKKYGMNGSAGFSTAQVNDDYLIFSGAYKFFPNALPDSYILKTEINGTSGCNESSINFQNSTITIISQNVIDSIFDYGLLIDTIFNSFDETTQIIDTLFCYSTVSIYDKQAEQSVLAFPNPTTGNFKIKNLNDIDGELLIHDSYGKSVFRIELKKGSPNEIPVYLNVSSGIYFINLKIENQLTNVQKLIIIN